jgi:murein L,D-transpeptidase YcbB/YkuD
VRVEDEIALAEFALAPDPEWTDARLRETLTRARDLRVPLPEPLPIHVLYFTAAAGADAAPTFSEDIYGWDAPLLRELDAAESMQASPARQGAR